MNKAFNSTPHHAMKSSGSTMTKTIGHNGNTGKASMTKPAPLTSRCASCGKKK